MPPAGGPPPIHEQQRERLRRTIDWARKIEANLADVRASRLGDLDDRLTPGAAAAREWRDHESATTGSELEDEFSRHCITCDHGRPTPEKRLQSYLLASAYRSHRHMVDLRTEGENPPSFITDELALPVEGGRIVCDLLALHGNRPVAIELKPSRAMTRLVEQVTGYARLVEAHLDTFAELFGVMLGRSVRLQAPCERWIVWPHPSAHARDPREEELARHGIRVVGGTETDAGFEFTVGRAVEGRGAAS